MTLTVHTLDYTPLLRSALPLLNRIENAACAYEKEFYREDVVFPQILRRALHNSPECTQD